MILGVVVGCDSISVLGFVLWIRETIELNMRYKSANGESANKSIKLNITEMNSAKSRNGMSIANTLCTKSVNDLCGPFVIAEKITNSTKQRVWVKSIIATIDMGCL